MTLVEKAALIGCFQEATRHGLPIKTEPLELGGSFVESMVVSAMGYIFLLRTVTAANMIEMQKDSDGYYMGCLGVGAGQDEVVGGGGGICDIARAHSHRYSRFSLSLVVLTVI